MTYATFTFTQTFFVQVVAGIKYDLTIKASVSQDCPNEGKPVTLEDCRPDMRTVSGRGNLSIREVTCDE